MRGHRDLRTAVALALLCAVLAPLLPVEVLSLLFVLPLAFILPGYALTAAIFARRAIGRTQMLVLSLGLSLSVLALGALLLNYVPGGIGPVSWAVLLALVVLGSCRSAALRRPRPSTAGRGQSWRGLRVTAVSAGLLLGALLCTAAALALTFTTTSATHAKGYTAMWLLPPTPADASAGGARVGVTSEEQRPTGYRLQVRVGDRSGQIIRHFSLNPGETKVLKLIPGPLANESSVAVNAELFRRSKPSDIYRHVSGWLARPQTKQ